MNACKHSSLLLFLLFFCLKPNERIAFTIEQASSNELYSFLYQNGQVVSIFFHELTRTDLEDVLILTELSTQAFQSRRQECIIELSKQTETNSN